MRTLIIKVTRLLVSFLLLLLSACTDSPRDTLRFGLASAPITLDPRFATDATSSRINRLLYQRLVDFDDTSQPIPALASWHSVTPTHYQFLLNKEGRVFHDGSLLTSADVKATYDSILDPQNTSPHRTVFTNIQRIETPDKKIVDFYLNKPDPLFPGRLVIGILPAKGITSGHAFNRSPIGTGPCAFLDWSDEGRLRLTRLADGQVFEFLHVPDPTVRVLKLLRGEIDMVQNDLPPELIAYLFKNGEVQVLRSRGSNFTYLGFNLNDGVVGRLGVRQAIAHALNRQAIIRYVLGDAARPATALLPPDHWAGNPILTPYRYDPERARALLKEEGFDSKNPARITYKTSSDPFRIRLATIIQRQLAQVGIDVDLRSYDWGTFYGDIKAGRFQMFSLTWVGIKTPDIFHTVFHSSSVPPNGANRGRFISAVADRLIETAEVSSNLETQTKHYRDLQAYLLEQLPYVPLWYEDHVFVARRDIVGYTLAVDGDYDGLMKVYAKRAMP